MTKSAETRTTAEAVNEKPVKAEDLITEIACAHEGLFEGEMKACGDKITYYMLNGQTFAISVAEIH